MKADVIDRIKALLPGFSKNQKLVAHYIMEHTEEAAFNTAARIGSILNISESTVVRFATAAGYKGFPDLQKALLEIVKNRLMGVNKLDITKNDSQSDIINYVMKNDADNIIATMNELDTDSFNLAADIISGAEKVYVTGTRSCAPLAELLGYYLRMVVKDVIIVTSLSPSEIFEQMINMSSRDVLIGISFPRYSARTLKAMEFANDRNAGVISITDTIYSPMNLYSSCNLLARSGMTSVTDSLAAAMSLINALVVALCAQNSNRVVKKLKKLRDVWDDYHISDNDEINFLDDDVMDYLKGLD